LSTPQQPDFCGETPIPPALRHSLTALVIGVALLSGCVHRDGPPPGSKVHPEQAAGYAIALEPGPPPSIRTKLSDWLETAKRKSRRKEKSVAAKTALEATVKAPGDVWERIRTGLTFEYESRKTIDQEIAWYRRNQDYLDRVAKRAERYLPYIIRELERRNMPADIALLPIVESAFQPLAHSHAGASGLWQFIPTTGEHYGLRRDWWYDGRRDVVEATRAAIDYLQKLNIQFKGDWLLSLAAYNAGESKVARAIRRNRRNGKATDFWALTLPRETRAYVPRMIAISNIVRHPEKHGLRLKPITDTHYFSQVTLEQQIDLGLVAEITGLSMQEIHLLNPAFSRWATAPQGPHRLLLPVAVAKSFRTKLQKLPPEHYVKWIERVIIRGESLGSIAKQYHISVAALKRFNNLSSNLIHAGQQLKVPVPRYGSDSYKLSARRPKGTKKPAVDARVRYTVRPGDSLYSIARHLHIPVSRLVRWNGIPARSLLQSGQRLVIWSREPTLTDTAVAQVPATEPVRYTVRYGDSQWQISRRFNIPVASLRHWNALDVNQLLHPGQQLNLYLKDNSAQKG